MFFPSTAEWIHRSKPRVSATALASRARPELEPYGKDAPRHQGRADACNAGEPSEMIEQLTKHGAANQPAEEVASEIGAAGNPSVCPCRLPDKAGRAGLCEEGADTDQDHAGDDVCKVRREHQRQAQ